METQHHARHPWWARAIVGILMLVLAFIGLIITDIYKSGAFNYWRIMVPIYALLSIGLTIYLRKTKQLISLVKIWQEIVHWLALICGVYLFSVFVQRGMMGRFEAALGILTLLAMTTFLAGIYLESSFIIIGLVLAAFAAGAALAAEYLYTIMLPLMIIVSLVILFIGYRKYKSSRFRADESQEDETKPPHPQDRQ